MPIDKSRKHEATDIPFREVPASGDASLAKDTAAQSQKAGMFTKSADDIKAMGSPKGLYGFWKNRTILGKVGIIAGMGAVTYAIVSAIGGKGSGERAEAVNRSRELGQSPAISA